MICYETAYHNGDHASTIEIQIILIMPDLYRIVNKGFVMFKRDFTILFSIPIPNKRFRCHRFSMCFVYLNRLFVHIHPDSGK